MNVLAPLHSAIERRASGERPGAMQAVAAATGAGVGVGVLVYRLLRADGGADSDDD